MIKRNKNNQEEGEGFERLVFIKCIKKLTVLIYLWSNKHEV